MQTYNLLPPPESSKSRHSKPLKPPEEPKIIISSETTNTSTVNAKTVRSSDNWLTTSRITKFEEVEEQNVNEPELTSAMPTDDAKQISEIILQPSSTNDHVQYIDAFTDLDPLGTGKSKPYVDKKYFFQDLKNPPKKVLKDLSDRDGIFSANFPSNANNRGDLSIFEEIHTPIENITTQSKLSDSRKSSDPNDTSIKPNEFTAHFAPETQIFSPNNIGTHGLPSATSAIPNASSEVFKIDLNTHKTDDPIIGNNKALLVTDNDPFSPRMKKFDPFEDDFSKKPMDPFEFNFVKGAHKSTILPDTKIVSEDKPKNDSDKRSTDETNGVFNGPLQVTLPPESYSAYMSSKRMERQTSDTSESISRNRPNVLKQNTVDALSSIGSKKIKPHIFSQKFSKRDSNMRRLQESDSLSENETAPEPPPRPDSNLHSEPPPLPPKKQFSDIVIRPRVTSPLATARESTKYDYLCGNKVSHSSHNQHGSDNIPALPLPSRRIGRIESNYPGPGRPEKRTNRDEDDYLTPISSKGDLPILLPPPQTKGSIKNRNRRHDKTAQNKIDTSNKSTIENERERDISPHPAIPDITLSQLLTLGIDDLAFKLNVPPTKLNTMTIVELTKYLSDFIEKSSQKSLTFASDPPVSVSSTVIVAPPKVKPPPPLKSATESAVFKVSFDDSSDATFIAKFDDNFGEDNDFIPNFDHFNETENSTIDKYAAFREIIEQEIKSEEEQPTESKRSDASNDNSSNGDSPTNEIENSAPIATKIDTKITQAISQAKDRYAALRDIILIEDLFEKPTSVSQTEATAQIAKYIDISISHNVENNFEETELHSSPDVNISINLEDHDEIEPLKSATPTICHPILGNKDDLEINEYMNRALSNLSLDSRDHLSPLSTKSPITKSQNASTSPIQRKPSPLCNIAENSEENSQKALLNDVSTSPIQKSPLLKSSLAKSPLAKSPTATASETPIAVQNNLKSPNQKTLIALETSAECAKDSNNGMPNTEYYIYSLKSKRQKIFKILFLLQK